MYISNAGRCSDRLLRLIYSIITRLISLDFFFSSRRRHTRCSRDWSSDVCSSDLNEISILLLAIELLERREEEAGLRRAVSYSTRILNLVEHVSPYERSSRVSVEQWELQKKNDLANTHFLRGDLYFRLRDYDAARKDLETSYEILPTAGAAQRLGERSESTRLNSSHGYISYAV